MRGFPAENDKLYFRKKRRGENSVGTFEEIQGRSSYAMYIRKGDDIKYDKTIPTR
jgi:hypothetical protein